MTFDRQKYLDAVKANLESNIFYHSLALEACMGGIYDYLQSQNQLEVGEPTREEWTLAGLIHDIDYAGETKELHPLKTIEVLQKFSLEIPPIVDRIVKDHDARQGKPANKAGWAIRCADSLTGLIVAVALVYPTKKLADVKTSSVLKRFLKEPKFAAGTRRDEVILCQDADKLALPLEKFIEICLDSMRKIAPEINL
ncbi:MAG: Metal dependent phosphohydrolase [Candidatus Shapirobacteria bacterium GW2011_GWE1_38_10]|uniref:Metal dependent phosphohydrolase n=1 Tax=Candidatus Shapirobacteria bacterium GW2011_GWE1_38_10 TaxID=1618488 RepID=A0A0G0KK75_9BACT|nr:MAG: Metal dependent phosphohydrolase [Candidatus Shapirobacteria bacterium GW2011_GWF2_37_20]KKQ49579.1 MAG: Metal dependent phosphohydrolase [Candidatus Shapirobacteria bacterium GW2011_GWE1_38_10]KKQ63397.1 MAG: Metal dependent phosphohydrolase [Candidatus Shapirobacteria bacterium GW2011_GWF1_38_23]HBP51281.1 phosphohydrolase [Candidatus Shapirobacteria bacterium]